jgi:hypothetical protein
MANTQTWRTLWMKFFSTINSNNQSEQEGPSVNKKNGIEECCYTQMDLQMRIKMDLHRKSGEKSDLMKILLHAYVFNECARI